jgi:polar amino acid transport system substrate-binding protein
MSALTATIISALAPTGRLRAAINTGNPILAARDTAGSAFGVSVDLAQALAHRLGLPLDLVVLDAAAQSVAAVKGGQADIGFFAIDPLRGEGLYFTAPYVLIEGAYLVRQDSPLHDNSEVDRSGHRIMVGQGSAYDLFLSREIQAATLLRAPTSPAVVQAFLDDGADVAAGVKPQIAAEAERRGGLRLLPGRFMEIRQAMGLPASRGLEAARVLSAFVQDMLSLGVVAESLRRHRIQGATLAPLQPPPT